MVSGKETGQTAHPSGPLSLEKRSMSSNQMTVSSTWPSKTTLSATDTRLHRTRNPGFKTPKVKMTPPTDKRTPVFVITVKCRGAAHPCFLYFCYLFKSSVYDLKIINYCYSHYIQWTRFWSKTSRKWYGPYALRKVGRKPSTSSWRRPSCSCTWMAAHTWSKGLWIDLKSQCELFPIWLVFMLLEFESEPLRCHYRRWLPLRTIVSAPIRTV